MLCDNCSEELYNVFIRIRNLNFCTPCFDMKIRKNQVYCEYCSDIASITYSCAHAHKTLNLIFYEAKCRDCGNVVTLHFPLFLGDNIVV